MGEILSKSHCLKSLVNGLLDPSDMEYERLRLVDTIDHAERDGDSLVSG